MCIIFTGFRWLLSEISDDYADLSRRVEKDTAEQVRNKRCVLSAPKI